MAEPEPTKEDMLECIKCLNAAVEDVLPQIGGIVLQDYGKLNRGLILAERILPGGRAGEDGGG